MNQELGICITSYLFAGILILCAILSAVRFAGASARVLMPIGFGLLALGKVVQAMAISSNNLDLLRKDALWFSLELVSWGFIVAALCALPKQRTGQETLLEETIVTDNQLKENVPMVKHTQIGDVGMILAIVGLALSIVALCLNPRPGGIENLNTAAMIAEPLCRILWLAGGLLGLIGVLSGRGTTQGMAMIYLTHNGIYAIIVPGDEHG